MKKISFVFTTINVPELIRDYLDNFDRFGWKNIDIIAIGDKKTPHDKVKELVNGLPGHGGTVAYFDIENQEKWLKDFPELAKIIPFNSDNRRNIGYLMALQNGADTIVSIDDDNYPTNENYLEGHSVVGSETKLPTVSTGSKWFNICSMLENNAKTDIYARGFPYSKRFQTGEVNTEEQRGKVAVNLGLWINYPDIDAVTHLTFPARILGMNKNYKKIMLGRNVFSPINSQNTAISKDALAAYYFVIMGAEFRGMKIDRYGDIWQGYFLKKIVDVMDERVAVGTPLADHRRNVHNLLKDLQCELWGMIMTEKLVDWVVNVDIESNKSYVDAYLELADKLKKDSKLLAEDIAVQKYFQNIADCMRVWSETYEKLK